MDPAPDPGRRSGHDPPGDRIEDRGEGPSRKDWWRRAVQILLTVGVTWFIVDRVGLTLSDVAELDPRWLRPSWILLGLATLVLLGGYVTSAALWGRMVREVGGPSLPVLRSVAVYFASNLGRYVPGKVWQLAGLAYLGRREGVPVSVSTGSAVLAQATSLAGASVVGAWALTHGPEIAGGTGPWIATAVVAAVVVLTVPPVFRRLTGLWFRVVGRGSPPSLRVSAGFGIRWVALFVVNWLLYAAAFWLMARSFGVAGSFPALGPAFAAAYVLGYAMIFAPAGIGVREGFLIAFLQPVTGPGPAAATAVLARFWMTAVELAPAAVFAAMLGAREPVDGAPARSDAPTASGENR